MLERHSVILKYGHNEDNTWLSPDATYIDIRIFEKQWIKGMTVPSTWWMFLKYLLLNVSQEL